MSRARTVFILFVVVTFVIPLLNVNGVAFAQQVTIDGAVPAVVRILGCNVAGCDVGLGSGVIIDPSGVVLTANHVTLADLKDPFSQLEDFLIEMSDSAQLIPQPRYRARLIAFKPESDLALLRIYWDERTNRPVDAMTLENLPTLPLANANTIALGERLHILGYPLAGGRAINYTLSAVGGFDENGTLIKLSTTLSEGNSGGPALVERNGRFEIAGVVLRRRGTLGEVGVIRRIDQLQGMQWLSNVQRVWVNNIQVSSLGTGVTAALQIQADVHALDMVNRRVYFLAYAFAADTYQPWRPSPTGLPRSATGQVVLSQEFIAQHPVDAVQTLRLEQHTLGADPEQLLFRLILWDAEATQILWQDMEWRRSQPTTEMALLPPPQTTLVLPATPTPVSLPTPIPTDTPTPPTATETTMPDLAATATSITYLLATSIAETLTALPTNTPTPTHTPNLAATTTAEAQIRHTAIAATLTTQPTVTPTPTKTPSLEQAIATSVVATLTALPKDTPTRLPTHTPTPTDTATRTPTPTATSACRPGVLYCEDFEDGRATGWGLYNEWGQPSAGWRVIRDDTNYVFSGEGHQFAILDNRAWADYRVSFRFKLEGGSFHLNYRIGQSGGARWMGRYYVGFSEDTIYLSKSLDNSAGFNVYSAPTTHRPRTWHQVEMVGWGGHLQVYVDDELELDYSDSGPLLTGTFGFESLDNSVQIDDIEVLPSGTEGEVPPSNSLVLDFDCPQVVIEENSGRQEFARLESAALYEPIVLDGGITDSAEWADAQCATIAMKHASNIINANWWLKNDEEWLYVLVRVPVSSPHATVMISYLWPEFDGRWPYSDLSSQDFRGEAQDRYGWDEGNWHIDTDDPPGEDNVEGATSSSDGYAWFEFRKMLHSGDEHDWDLYPGDTFGYASTGDLQLGLWDNIAEEYYFHYATISLAKAGANSQPELLIDAATLNVRKGPGSSYAGIGVAKSGERYTITGRNSNSTWWQIDFKGQSGWVSDGYVKLLNPTQIPAIEPSFTGIWHGPDPDDGSIITLSLEQTATTISGEFSDTFSRSVTPGFYGLGNGEITTATAARTTFNLTRHDGENLTIEFYLTLLNEGDTLLVEYDSGQPITLKRQ